MSKRLSDKQIVGEAMYSVRHSLGVNIPLPPTNPDGSFKSLDQMANERKMLEWGKVESDKALVAEMDRASANDPAQLRWEQEQRMNRRVEYEFVIPDGVKAIFYLLLFIGCVIVLALTG